MVAIDESQSTETSVQLLREFERTGDAAPFEAFMRRHAAMVYATCLKVTRDPHDAEDATQATFLTLASKSRLNGEIRQPEAWLRKVAHRLSLDLIRSKKRRINRENLRSEMTTETAPLDSSDHAGNGELKGILNEELAKLPASYRMPLILHYFGGLSREEMADQLKLKPSTLGVRLHRAREQLRKRLSNRGVALPAVALTALLSEVVRQSVCAHLMTTTAQQASAIALGHVAAPVFSVGPGVHTFRLLTELIGGSKLRVLISSLVLGSAISMTSAQVQEVLPRLIRDLIPSFRAPSVPSIEFKVPAPRLLAVASSTDPVDYPVPAAVSFTSLPAARPDPIPVGSRESPSFFTNDHAVRSAVPPALPLVVEAIGPGAPAPRPVTSARESVSAAPSPVKVRSSSVPRLATPATSPRAENEPPAVVAVPSPSPGHDSWNSVIPEQPNDAGPSVPLASNAHVGQDLPETVSSAVLGSVPRLGGGGGGSGQSSGATPLASAQGPSAPAAIPARTATFAGTSANYGGYADANWAMSKLVDLSDSLLENGDESFSAPPVPGEAQTLSINGARVTLKNASSEDPVTIAFVDTAATQIPALPLKHHFIGVWELNTASSFEAVELLVRYDDLRAARLGLNEQLLKLWVSDGDRWTLMWNDPTFGRDAYQNLLWVNAGDDVRFFAVSAPEPATLTALAAAAMLGARRRRNA